MKSMKDFTEGILVDVSDDDFGYDCGRCTGGKLDDNLESYLEVWFYFND